MMRSRFLFFLCILSFLGGIVYGQDSPISDPDSTGVVKDRLLPTSTPILMFTDATEEVKEKKKKKKKKAKKNIYFGERTKRNMIRSSFRDQVTVQLFNTTPKNKNVDSYIRDIYWYEPSTKSIKKGDFNPASGVLLHGPYEKRINENVIETGMYFFGTKHGRWMTYDGKNILVNKSHYSEGWPKESRVTYYNREQRKIEKLTPIEYDLEEGNFYHFYPDGQVAVIGEYRFGERVGLWTEYWNTSDDKVIRKREIQYQPQPFSKNFRPFIRAEWDKQGNLIYKNDG